MKESLRAVFAGDLSNDEVRELLERSCSRASRSRIMRFVRLSKTDPFPQGGNHGFYLALSLYKGASNGRAEGLNTKICSIIAVSITARFYGLHFAEATLAMAMLSCGPIDLKLTYERTS